MPQRVYLSHYSWASPPHLRDSDVYGADFYCDGQSISYPEVKVNSLNLASQIYSISIASPKE